MTDNTELINLFVSNFILKNRRERSRNQLTGKNRRKFTNCLNHTWDSIFNMTLLHELTKNERSYMDVRQMLKLNDNDCCYIISDEKMDNTFLPFSGAFEKISSASFGSLLINLDANRLFLKTECMQGPPPQYIGISH